MAPLYQEKVDYGPGTGLLVVDLQNDFADRRGSLYVDGSEQIVPVANEQVRRAAAGGAAVIYTQDWHPPHTPHFAQDGGIWPVHCVAGTWGAAFVPDLLVEGSVVHKGTGGEDGYSGFSVRDVPTGAVSATRLAELLSAARVRQIVLCGVATDYCVKETSLDAIGLGYRVIVLTGAVRAVDREPGDGERALEAMAAAGAELR
jgi:nicotinamidase/pyrazinamidase